MPADPLTEARRLAAKKMADKYVGRDGKPPHLVNRAALARGQDLNDDDRRHLKWCFKQLRISNSEHWDVAVDFIEAILTRDYRLDIGETRPEDESAFVVASEDPELYDHLQRKRGG